MAETSYDIAVVGGGPGGYTAAVRSAQLGLKTCIIERERLGGVCLNWGCVPTKALLRNAEILRLLQKADEWGISTDAIRVDFPRIIKRSRGIADRISKGVEYLMKKNAVTTIPGTATLVAGNTIAVRGEGAPVRQITARHIILATGARPRSLPGVPFDRTRILTSTDAMTLAERPASMVIIGAGAIGVEFAYFYNALGTNVTLLELLPSVLPLEDREVTKLLESSLRKQGLTISTSTRVERVETTDDGVRVFTVNEEGNSVVKAEVALVAVGVQGNVENLGLEELGVAVERGRIVVDQEYRTSVPGVCAVGDVIGPPWLAHVASAEAIHCVESIAGKNPAPLAYDTIPGCTYCQPQVASVGMTEEKAREAGLDVRIGRFPFRPLGKAMATGETEGLVKLIFDAKYGEILGAHILGADATEMIAELVLAKKMEVTGPDLYHTVHAHPTLSEAVMEAAAAAYGEAINI